VREWSAQDDPILLLRLKARELLPPPVKRYLSSPEAGEAKLTYKCRNREPWYVVPDVTIPDAFLTYMSGGGPALVANEAGCVCTNSVHAVNLKGTMSIAEIQSAWERPMTKLSCEIEGHPLGGGILKLEPREASRVLLARRKRWSREEALVIEQGLNAMQRWRHHGGERKGRAVRDRFITERYTEPDGARLTA